MSYGQNTTMNDNGRNEFDSNSWGVNSNASGQNTQAPFSGNSGGVDLNNFGARANDNSNNIASGNYDDPNNFGSARNTGRKFVDPNNFGSSSGGPTQGYDDQNQRSARKGVNFHDPNNFGVGKPDEDYEDPNSFGSRRQNQDSKAHGLFDKVASKVTGGVVGNSQSGTNDNQSANTDSVSDASNNTAYSTPNEGYGHDGGSGSQNYLEANDNNQRHGHSHGTAEKLAGTGVLGGAAYEEGRHRHANDGGNNGQYLHNTNSGNTNPNNFGESRAGNHDGNCGPGSNNSNSYDNAGQGGQHTHAYGNQNDSNIRGRDYGTGEKLAGTGALAGVAYEEEKHRHHRGGSNSYDNSGQGQDGFNSNSRNADPNNCGASAAYNSPDGNAGTESNSGNQDHHAGHGHHHGTTEKIAGGGALAGVAYEEEKHRHQHHSGANNAGQDGYNSASGNTDPNNFRASSGFNKRDGNAGPGSNSGNQDHHTGHGHHNGTAEKIAGGGALAGVAYEEKHRHQNHGSANNAGQDGYNSTPRNTDPNNLGIPNVGRDGNSNLGSNNYNSLDDRRHDQYVPTSPSTDANTYGSINDTITRNEPSQTGKHEQTLSSANPDTTAPYGVGSAAVDGNAAARDDDTFGQNPRGLGYGDGAPNTDANMNMDRTTGTYDSSNVASANNTHNALPVPPKHPETTGVGGAQTGAGVARSPTGKTRFEDKLKGAAEKLVGKLSGNSNMAQSGQSRMTQGGTQTGGNY